MVLSPAAAACSRAARVTPDAPGPAARGAPREREDAAGSEVFAAAGVEGVFVLRSLATEEQIVTDAKLAGTRELPASTFKIPSAVIALQQGVLAGADTTLRWDGVTREVAAWNRDHTLASALRDSTVWYFQEAARRVGQAALQASLQAFAYGNADIGGGIDRFWLTGQLRISPREQVEFMARLARRELPAPARDLELVEHLITRAQAPGWSWRGKTGLGDDADRAVGWLVGLCERAEQAWAYALMVRAPATEIERMIPLRPQLARALLVRYGALPADVPG